MSTAYAGLKSERRQPETDNQVRLREDNEHSDDLHVILPRLLGLCMQCVAHKSLLL